MINELELLILLSNKDTYERLFKYIKDNTITKESNKLLKAFTEYFIEYPTETSIDFSKFSQFFFLKKGYVTSTSEVSVYQHIIQSLSAKTYDPALVDDLKNALLTKDYFTKIADTAIKAGMGTSDLTIDDIEDLVIEYNTEVKRASAKEADVFVDPDLTAMSSEVFSKGYEWRLEELNNSAGPARPGDFIMVAATVETGKTTFLASEVTYMAQQLSSDECVLWLNNEERGVKVMYRIVQAALGIDKGKITLDPVRYMAEYEKLMGRKDKIKLPKDSMGISTTRDIEQLIKIHRPKIIVFDQLDKFKGFYKSEREDLRLGAMYSWARDLGKQYEAVVIAATQADGSAMNCKFIQGHQLRGSKVDKQGEGDLIITIGREDDTSMIRGLHLPKNKLNGGDRSDEARRHGYYDVTIKPEIARYEGFLKNPGIK